MTTATFWTICNACNPILQENGHYKLFDPVYGTETSDEHRPLQKQLTR